MPRENVTLPSGRVVQIDTDTNVAIHPESTDPEPLSEQDAMALAGEMAKRSTTRVPRAHKHGRSWPFSS